MDSSFHEPVDPGSKSFVSCVVDDEPLVSSSNVSVLGNSSIVDNDSVKPSAAATRTKHDVVTHRRMYEVVSDKGNDAERILGPATLDSRTVGTPRQVDISRELL